ncbi:MAG: rRNA pseudouridine synthase [Bacteroidetes bacterium]|nr:MAG: rRNA pseudouridine synthase [Bacteroidota bacterium]
MVHKPRNMVSQFVSSHQVGLLGQLNFPFPPGTHAIGRLDNQSEGLLLLTTNKNVTRLLFQSAVPHQRRYLVQVKYSVSAATLLQLQQGVSIQVRGGGYYVTQPCSVALEPHPEQYINTMGGFVEHHPHSWLTITLTEGKYHQVRKMVDAVGHRCTRLVRISIENMHLGSLPSGAVHEWDEATFFSLLNLTQG